MGSNSVEGKVQGPLGVPGALSPDHNLRRSFTTGLGLQAFRCWGPPLSPGNLHSSFQSEPREALLPCIWDWSAAFSVPLFCTFRHNQRLLRACCLPGNCVVKSLLCRGHGLRIVICTGPAEDAEAVRSLFMFIVYKALHLSSWGK